MRRVVIIAFLCALGALVLTWPPSPGRGAPRDYVGAKACATCHQEVYASWAETAHARTVDALGKRANDAACLGCHGTGPKGALRAVECEACHGPGAAYIPDDIMRNRFLARRLGLTDASDLEATCMRCHRRGTRVGTFDAKEAWKRIGH